MAISYMAPPTNLINIYAFLFMAMLITPSVADLEAGFSQGCYSACPRKTWTL